MDMVEILWGERKHLLDGALTGEDFVSFWLMGAGSPQLTLIYRYEEANSFWLNLPSS